MYDISEEDDQMYRLMAVFYMAGGKEFREQLIALLCDEVNAYRRAKALTVPERIDAGAGKRHYPVSWE